MSDLRRKLFRDVCPGMRNNTMSNINKTLPDYETRQPTSMVWLCIIIVALAIGSCAMLTGCV